MGIRKILSKGIGSGEGPKPLSFQKALSVLLFIACPFLFVAGYLSKSTDNTPAIRLWAWGSFLAGVAFAAWIVLPFKRVEKNLNN